MNSSPPERTQYTSEIFTSRWIALKDKFRRTDPGFTPRCQISSTTPSTTTNRAVRFASRQKSRTAHFRSRSSTQVTAYHLRSFHAFSSGSIGSIKQGRVIPAGRDLVSRLSNTLLKARAEQSGLAAASDPVRLSRYGYPCRRRL